MDKSKRFSEILSEIKHNEKYDKTIEILTMNIVLLEERNKDLLFRVENIEETVKEMQGIPEDIQKILTYEEDSKS